MLATASALFVADATERPVMDPVDVILPAPRSSGALSLEEAIARRRSTRELAPRPLAVEEIGQLVWAAQGITDPVQGRRAAPSAGALYPLELYVVKADGTYHYDPVAHGLHRVDGRDLRGALSRATHDQAVVRRAPVDFVIVGFIARTRTKYGERAERYVALEAGHTTQNILLEATALGLGAVPVGSFDDDEVRGVLALQADATPLYVVPVGHPD
jgi:SagB-type dehydrogenase family enzyme